MGLKAALIAAAFVVISLPANAAWKVTSKVDRMTDKAEKTASVTAKAPDHGVSATLYVYCLGFKGDTNQIVNIQTTARFTPAQGGARL